MSSERHRIVLEDCARVASGHVAALEPLRNSTLVITGGTGFTGTWLTELIAYLNDQHGFGTKIILLSQRARTFGDKAPHLSLRKDVQLVEKDVRAILELPEDTRWIIHAAASPDNRLHSSDPVRTVDVIVNGTKSVLLAAARLPNLAKMLNISSGLVYGGQPMDLKLMPETHWTGFDCAPVNTCYAEAKRLGETLCAAYRNEHRLSIVTARPFTFIGPYQLLDRPWAVNNFIRDSLSGGPVRVQGDGETVRAYLYAADMALWYLRILVSGREGQAYNVGSSEGVRLKDLAEQITDHFPARPKIEFGVMKGGRMPVSRLVPDTTLAKTSLNLTAGTDLSDAIRRTLQWHRI